MAYDDHVVEHFEREQEAIEKAFALEEKVRAWAKLSLASLTALRTRLHQTHTTHAASSELGTCYICGDGVNELIRQGEELFP